MCVQTNLLQILYNSHTRTGFVSLIMEKQKQSSKLTLGCSLSHFCFRWRHLLHASFLCFFSTAWPAWCCVDISMVVVAAIEAVNKNVLLYWVGCGLSRLLRIQHEQVLVGRTVDSFINPLANPRGQSSNTYVTFKFVVWEVLAVFAVDVGYHSR